MLVVVSRGSEIVLSCAKLSLKLGASEVLGITEVLGVPKIRRRLVVAHRVVHSTKHGLSGVVRRIIVKIN